jgi:predicted Zn-dependent peptidase
VRTEPGERVLPPDPPAPPDPAETPTQRPPSAEPWRTTVPALGPAAAITLPGAQRFELDNGLPVYLVESHDLPITVASLVKRWGSAADPPERPGLAAFTADLLDEGTQTRDALGIVRELDALGAFLFTGADGGGSSVAVAALSSRMNQALAVMSDVVRGPAFPPAEVDRVRGDVGLLTLQTSGSTEATGASIRELLDEVAAMREAPVSAEELARAKDSLSLSLPADFATGSDTAAAVGRLYLADLPPDYYQALPAAIAQIDADDARAVARAHLRPEEMKVVAVGDRAQLDPQLAELALGPVTYRNPDGTPVPSG